MGVGREWGARYFTLRIATHFIFYFDWNIFNFHHSYSTHYTHALDYASVSIWLCGFICGFAYQPHDLSSTFHAFDFAVVVDRVVYFVHLFSCLCVYGAVCNAVHLRFMSTWCSSCICILWILLNIVLQHYMYFYGCTSSHRHYNSLPPTTIGNVSSFIVHWECGVYACESECFAEDFSLLFVFSFSKWRPVASTHCILRTTQNIRCVRCHYSGGFLQHTSSSIPFFACSLNKRTKYEGHLVVLCAVVLNL